MKELRKGDIYYNQQIPTEELWEDTLKKEDLRIYQLDVPVGVEVFNMFNVTMYKPENGKLVVVDQGDLSRKEIERVLNNRIEG